MRGTSSFSSSGHSTDTVSLPPRLPVALDLILAIGALILLGVMIHSLVSRIFRPPLFADRKSPKWFKHLFPFCIFPLFIMFPEPVKRPVMRQRKNTWSVLFFLAGSSWNFTDSLNDNGRYPEPDERTPLL